MPQRFLTRSLALALVTLILVVATLLSSLSHAIEIPDPLPLSDPEEIERHYRNGPHLDEEITDFEACSMCEWIMQRYENRSDSGVPFRPDIFVVLDEICRALPRTVEAQCDAFAGQSMEIVMNYMDAGKPPAQFCTKEKYCKPKNVAYDETGTCVLCEWIMSTMADHFGLKVRDHITESTTENQLVVALDSVRGVLPASVSRELNILIDEAGPSMLKNLMEMAKFSDVCAGLKLCDNLFRISYITGRHCVACQWIWKTHWTQLLQIAKAKSEPESQSATSSDSMSISSMIPMCDSASVPSLMRPDCRRMIEKAGLGVLAAIKAKEKTNANVNAVASLSVNDGMSVCRDARACYELGGNENPECMYCDWLGGWVQAESNSLANTVERMEAGCGDLPEEYRQACKDFIHMHGVEVRSSVKREREMRYPIAAHRADPSSRPTIDTDAACVRLALCKNATELEAANSIPPEELEQQYAEGEQEIRSNECGLCQWLIHEYQATEWPAATPEPMGEGEGHNHDHADGHSGANMMIQTRFIETCHRLPESLHADCTNWVRGFAHEMESFDPDTRSPDSFCELLDMCVREVSRAEAEAAEAEMKGEAEAKKA